MFTFCGRIRHTQAQLSQYLYSGCCRSPSRCSGPCPHLAHPAVQEPVGASCAGTTSPPRSPRCWGTDRRRSHGVPFPSTPALLSPARPHWNECRIFKMCRWVHNSFNPILPSGCFYSSLLNFLVCLHPKPHPASNSHLHSCQSPQSTGCFLPLSLLFTAMYSCASKYTQRHSHIYSRVYT